MGIVNSLKKKLSESIDNVRESRDQHKQDIESKHEALKLFTMSQLKDLCNQYGVGQPPSFHRDILSGEKIKNKMNREEYLNYIVKKVPLDNIISYADRHRISVPLGARQKESIIRPRVPTSSGQLERQDLNDKPSPGNESQSAFDEIVSFIESEYQHQIHNAFFRNENQFNDNLYVALGIKFGNTHIIENRRRTMRAGDIVIDGKYVLELKFANNPGTLNNGLAELKTYKNMYQKICMIMLDVNAIPGKIQEFRKFYYEDGADKVIVLRGKAEG